MCVCVHVCMHASATPCSPKRCWCYCALFRSGASQTVRCNLRMEDIVEEVQSCSKPCTAPLFTYSLNWKSHYTATKIRGHKICILKGTKRSPVSRYFFCRFLSRSSLLPVVCFLTGTADQQAVGQSTGSHVWGISSPKAGTTTCLGGMLKVQQNVRRQATQLTPCADAVQNGAGQWP